MAVFGVLPLHIDDLYISLKHTDQKLIIRKDRTRWDLFHNGVDQQENLTSCPPPIWFKFTDVEGDGEEWFLRQKLAAEVDIYYA